jgi:iron(III) transport system permease protein
MASFSVQRSVHEYRRMASDWTLLAGLLLVTLFLIVAIVWPLVKILGVGFSAQALPILGEYFTIPAYQRVLVNTLELGVSVGLLGTALGFLFAFVQVRVDVPGKRFLHWVALVPVVSPPFAVAMSAIQLFGRGGIIFDHLFGLHYNIRSLQGLIFVLTLSFFTIAYLNLSGMLRALDPALDEAATNLGADQWDIFRKITLPMLIPGLANSFLLLFIEAIADLANPMMLGGDVLAGNIYFAYAANDGMLRFVVLSLLLLAPSLTVFALQHYWVSRRSVVSVTGRPSGQTRLITNPLAKWTLFGVVLFFSILVLTIYGTIFIGAFTQLLGIDNHLTLEHFAFVLFGYGSEAITDTTLLATIATPVIGILSMVVAWLVVRKQFAGRSILDFASLLALAVPGTVLGMGYLLTFSDPIRIGSVTILPALRGGTTLAGGAIAIVLAFAARGLPAGVRSGVASLQQVDPAIEEAASTLGADSATIFRKVSLPLIRPALMAGLVFGFVRSMTSLSAIIFLTTPETKIMTAQIWNEADAGRFGNAFAYCVILILVVLTVIGILSVVIGRTTGVERELASH